MASVTKVSLHVGLNYPGTSAELRGCVQDALDWREAAAFRGFATSLMLDGEATKANTVGVLRSLVAPLRSGDHFLFTYSGHGSWVPDRDGDEADGRDEVLVLADYLDGGILTDDELHTIIDGRRRGVKVTIVSDSCHSGSVQRAFSEVIVRSAKTLAGPWREDRVEVNPPKRRPARPRFLPPVEFLDGADLVRARTVESVPARGVPRAGAVLLSGCSDLEVSYDGVDPTTGRPRGALTMAALEALGEEPRTMRAWHQRVLSMLPSARYPYAQTPQLQASTFQSRRKPLG